MSREDRVAKADRVIDNSGTVDELEPQIEALWEWIDGLPESGMGLFIIRSFMDEVVYEPGSPNVLRIAKCL